MYIRGSRRKNGKTYLQIVEPYWENGKSKARHIRSLGYKEDLALEHPDLQSYLDEVLEEAQMEFGEKEKDYINIKVYRDQTEPTKNLGYGIPKKIYSKLKIKNFLNNRTRHKGLPYNLNQIFLLLVMNRFVDPGSKRKAYRKRDLFFERFNFSEQQMYQSLSVLAELSDKMQAHLYKETQKLIELDKNTCKYDVTNFYFFSERGDEDEVDENGEIIKKGLRQSGPSREGVHHPICQVGLLCDRKGIPMSFDIFSGGESEKTTFLPLIDNAQRKLELPRIIVIADRGINTASNMYGLSGDNGAYKSSRRSRDEEVFLTKERNGFIFGQTIRNQSEDRIDWILNPADYEVIEVDGITLKFKSRIYNRTIKVNTVEGKKSQRKIRVKELVYYNSLYDRRCKYERYELLKKALSLLQDKGRYNHKLKTGGGKLIKSSSYSNVDGKKVKADEQKLEIDMDKILNDEKLDGYYCLVTSELEMADVEVWENYSQLHDIEDCFRVTKHELLIRPPFVWTENSIRAHVLICYVALLIFRILRRISDNQFTSEEIFEGIQSYNCNYGGESIYIFGEMNEVIKGFSKILDLDYKKHYMSSKEIRSLLKY